MTLVPTHPNQPKLHDLSNIVAINPGANEELEITKHRFAEDVLKCCGIHKHIIVDSKSRTIKCSKCGFVIDPFDYIEQWAKEGDRRMEGLDGIEVKTRIARLQYEDLERKIKNARGTLRRAGQQQTTTEQQFRNNEEYRAQRIAQQGL